MTLKEWREWIKAYEAAPPTPRDDFYAQIAQEFVGHGIVIPKKHL